MLDAEAKRTERRSTNNCDNRRDNQKTTGIVMEKPALEKVAVPK